MRETIGVIAAKLTARATRLTGGGTALPGLVAEKISPNLLVELVNKNFPKGVVLVTGTNGKTTTARLIAQLLNDAGNTVVHNRAGSNLPRGIISTLVGHSTTNGSIKADMAVLEVDEGYFPRLLVQLKPQTVVLTNIFRDQLDRYGEVDSIVKAFAAAFTEFSPPNICMNADDPLLVSIAYKARLKPVYFGMASYTGPTVEHDYVTDMIDDPIDQKPLLYKQRYYGHIGIYRSESGKFKRPDCIVEAQNVVNNHNQEQEIDVKVSTESKKLVLSLEGSYNVYNALASIAVGYKSGINNDIIFESLSMAQAAFGRVQTVELGAKKATILLIKNPAGFNQVIANFICPKPHRPVLFVINDNLADGRDISWLWDSGLEDLASFEAPVIVSGSRALDMALRLRYAGLPPVVIETDITLALSKFADLVDSKGGNIVPTYTGLLQIQQYLSKTNHKDKW